MNYTCLRCNQKWDGLEDEPCPNCAEWEKVATQPAHARIAAWTSATVEGYARGVEDGMVVGAAIIAWAEAIRVTYPWCQVVDRHYYESEIRRVGMYTCHCPGCGAYMKGLVAGEDEGTENEWCGSCRH